VKHLIGTSQLKIFVIIILILTFLLLGTYRLNNFPPLWWDEGWTLTVAKNWVKFGHYGQIRNGELLGPGLSAAFPVVAPVALSFKLFGIGIWQGRLPGLFFTLGALALMFYLAQALYNRKVAFGTLFVLIFMQGRVDLNPLLLGRQVLGEMPLMFYLLVGYIFFLLSLNRSTWFTLPVAVFWGIAVRTKAQVFPFWFICLLLPLVVSIYKKWWKESIVILLCLVGSWLMQIFLPYIQITLGGEVLSGGDQIDGLIYVTGFVLNPDVRMKALLTVLFLGWTTIIGLKTSGYLMIRLLRNQSLPPRKYLVNLSLLTLSGSWLLWYLLFGSFWQRYLFPPLFLGGMYVAVLLFNLTDGFDAGKVVFHLTYPLRYHKFSIKLVWSGLVLLIVGLGLAFSYIIFPKNELLVEDTSLKQVASYFDSKVSLTALIETYDSELFFVLEQPFHYPPDQAHVVFNRQTLLGEEIVSIYNPMTVNPDYLIVGPFSKMWHVYDNVLSDYQFELILDTKRYQVYKNVEGKTN
jgi:hypothetical protein